MDHLFRLYDWAQAAACEEELLRLRAIRSSVTIDIGWCRQMHEASPMMQVAIVQLGMHPRVIREVARQMSLPEVTMMTMLGLSPEDVRRKKKGRQLLSPTETSRTMGLVRLIGQVTEMVDQSGDLQGFSASAWLGQWLLQPLPAFSGHAPAEWMDTAEGQGFVAQAVRQMQSAVHV